MASQPKDDSPRAVVLQNLTVMAPEFKAALPEHIPVERFRRVAQTAILSNMDLMQADRASLWGAVTKLAQDGLLPDGREAALVIFNAKQGNGWIKKVQAMPMIAGVLKKVRQSGEVASVDCHVVYANDAFTYRPGIDTQPIFEPDWFGDRGKPIGAYAIATLKSGEVVPPEIMSLSQIDKVRNVSRSKDKGPWVDWWDEMARKTVMRRFAKRLPSSTDLEDQIFSRDETMGHEAPRPVLIEGGATEVQPISRLDALEHQISDGEYDDGTGELPAHEPEGRTDEQHGDQYDDDQPAWAIPVAAIRANIANAKSLRAVTDAENEFLKHRAVLPDDVVGTVEAEITAARKAHRAA